MNDMSHKLEIDDKSHYVMESSIAELEIFKILIEKDQKSNDKQIFQN